MNSSGEAKKSLEDLQQRLDKLKARTHPKNSLKKLPGYGSTWVYRKRNETSSDAENEDGATLHVDASHVTAFVKKLRTRPPPEEMPEEEGEVVSGPGFEFPTEKEAIKYRKHWSKRFKREQSPEGLVVNSSAAPRPVIRFKTPLPGNEVEVDGKRYRRVETLEDMQSLVQKGVPLIEKRRPTLHDARFYRELLREDYDHLLCRVMMEPDDYPAETADVRDLLTQFAITKIYAPVPVASRIVSGMKTYLNDHGRDAEATALTLESDSTGEDRMATAARAHDPSDPLPELQKGNETTEPM